MKPGISTTEFWLHALAQISGMAMAFLPSNKYVQLAGAVIQLVNPATYTFFRSNLKKIAMDAGSAALGAVQADLSGVSTASQPVINEVAQSPKA